MAFVVANQWAFHVYVGNNSDRDDRPLVQVGRALESPIVSGERGGRVVHWPSFSCSIPKLSPVFFASHPVSENSAALGRRNSHICPFPILYDSF